MAKIVILLLLCLFFLFGNDKQVNPQLSRECLECHQVQEIPSEIIYRRYLLKYSSKKTIKKKMFAYHKNPSMEDSIMPPQFFGRFTLKEPSKLSKEILQQCIDAYIDHYDVNQKLFIPPEH